MFLRFGLLTSLGFTAAIFGFFYAWVCSTMWGLDQLPPATAIEAMNAMNRSVRNAVFAPAFFGTPVVLIAVAIWGWVQQYRQVALLLIVAAVLYIAGAFVLTMNINVPMNLALMETDMAQPVKDLAGIWTEYSERWQFWNTVRTMVSGLCVLLVGWALLIHGTTLEPRQRAA